MYVCRYVSVGKCGQVWLNHCYQKFGFFFRIIQVIPKFATISMWLCLFISVYCKYQAILSHFFFYKGTKRKDVVHRCGWSCGWHKQENNKNTHPLGIQIQIGAESVKRGYAHLKNGMNWMHTQIIKRDQMIITRVGWVAILGWCVGLSGGGRRLTCLPSTSMSAT